MKIQFVAEWTMSQAWLPAPEPGLQRAVVRAGWKADALVVEAELGDLDPFNPAKAFNEVAYTKGDVFEIFVRPESQDAYFEFHITPENQVLQLRWADAGAIKRSPQGASLEDSLAPAMVWQPRITSETRVDRSAAKWFVRAEIPFALVVEKGVMRPGTRWFVSFCRYDYTRGQEQPVLASISPHAKCSFHRQEEWPAVAFPGV